MFIPAGKPLHENLSTSYVDVRALFDEMQREKFTGYVHLNFEVRECYVFFDKGQIINAIDSEAEHRLTGLAAIDSTIAIAEKRRGRIGLYQHSAQIVAAISGLIDGEVVFKDLSSEFTNLQKLVDKLGTSTRREHYVLVQFENGGTGLISVGRGKLDGVYSSSEGSVRTREEAIREMLSQVQTSTATINVYQAPDRPRGEQILESIASPPQPEKSKLFPVAEAPAWTAQVPPAAEQGGPRPRAPSSPPEELVQPEPAAIEPPKPESQFERPAPPVQPSPAGTFRLSAGTELTTSGVIGGGVIQHSPQPAAVAPPPSGTGPATARLEEAPAPADTSKPELNFDELLPLIGEVIAVVERTSMVGGRDNGEFGLALKEGMLELTDDYPFLDPFAAEIEYQMGQLEFAGQATVTEFVAGIAGALRACVQTLATRRADKTLIPRVREHLVKFQDQHRRQFDRYGLGILIATIAE